MSRFAPWRYALTRKLFGGRQGVGPEMSGLLTTAPDGARR